MPQLTREKARLKEDIHVKIAINTSSQKEQQGFMCVVYLL